MNHFLWDVIKIPHSEYHYGVLQLEPDKGFLKHDHDFAEVMLVESGSAKHKINGKNTETRAGSLFFIRPSDKHSLQAGKVGIKYHNCAFPMEYCLEMETKYFSGESGYFKRNEKSPYFQQLINEQFLQTVTLMHNLAGHPHSRFVLDHFLITLYEIIRKSYQNTLSARMPDWLNRVCTEIQQPEMLARGVDAFFSLACRSREHTSRELKRFTGKTPTEFINELRLEIAGKLLCITSQSIIEVAYNCGFENLSWFHRCFRLKYGVTPLQYRRKNIYN
jgi:AraC family cel operon transcriptional repressor